MLFRSSSSINGLLYVRGQPQDFDQWRQLGNPGWAWDDVMPLFRRAENWEGEPSAVRGKGGALLQRGYVPVPEATDQVGDLAVESTQHDLELLREQLIRCALLLGVSGRAPIAAEGALLPAALRAALPTAPHPEGAPRRSRPAPPLVVADPSTMEDALSRASDPDGVICVAERTNPRWPTAIWSPALRLLLPAVEGRRALLFDDLVALEHGHESGLIVATHLAHHGTMLARVLVPESESWELLPSAGSGLPLVAGL